MNKSVILLDYSNAIKSNLYEINLISPAVQIF